jgi:hypothetical protein
MVRRRFACAVIAACSVSAFASPVLAGPRAILELFTSQGCSSCPAADQLLGQLAADPSLIAISVPIDVWDYLGWKDTLADHRNTLRWQGYSKSRGDGQRYTPQIVANGSAHALGSDRAAIERAIAKSRSNDAVLSVEVKLSRGGDQLVIDLPESAPAAPASVWVWALAKAKTVMIGRGENKGRTVTYHNVKRHAVNLGPWTAASHRWSVPIRSLAGESLAAVMVQTGTVEKPSFILGAAMMEFR